MVFRIWIVCRLTTRIVPLSVNGLVTCAARAGIELVSIERPRVTALHWKSMSETELATPETKRSALGDEIVGRINQFATISETHAQLARIFLSPEHRIAADLILSWMRDAGMLR